MPAAEARIQTSRPGRYLTQICQHVAAISGATGSPRHRQRLHRGGGTQPAEAPPRAEWSATRGLISFTAATITLQAGLDVLVLHAEAGDEQGLRHAQDLITGLLDRISRRDHLTVRWQRTDLPPSATPCRADSACGPSAPRPEGT